jgi:hypothetical protein
MPQETEATEATEQAEESEILWHIEQIAKNRAILEQLDDGNTAGGEVFPETQSEIERVKAQIAQFDERCGLSVHIRPRSRRKGAPGPRH